MPVVTVNCVANHDNVDGANRGNQTNVGSTILYPSTFLPPFVLFNTHTAMRFGDHSIPFNATINSAFLKWVSNSADTGTYNGEVACPDRQVHNHWWHDQAPNRWRCGRSSEFRIEVLDPASLSILETKTSAQANNICVLRLQTYANGLIEQEQLAQEFTLTGGQAAAGIKFVELETYRVGSPVGTMVLELRQSESDPYETQWIGGAPEPQPSTLIATTDPIDVASISNSKVPTTWTFPTTVPDPGAGIYFIVARASYTPSATNYVAVYRRFNSLDRGSRIYGSGQGFRQSMYPGQFDVSFQFAGHDDAGTIYRDMPGTTPILAWAGTAFQAGASSGVEYTSLDVTALIQPQVRHSLYDTGGFIGLSARTRPHTGIRRRVASVQHATRAAPKIEIDYTAPTRHARTAAEVIERVRASHAGIRGRSRTDAELIERVVATANGGRPRGRCVADLVERVLAGSRSGNVAHCDAELLERVVASGHATERVSCDAQIMERVTVTHAGPRGGI